jgi:lactoylglutathione lyase
MLAFRRAPRSVAGSETSMQGAPAPRFTLSAVRLFVDDTAVAARFYGETLGLPLAFVAPEQGFLGYMLGATSLIIERADPTDEESRALVGRFAAVSLGTPDVAAEHLRMVGLGVTFTAVPANQPWGGCLAHFRDPAGNTLSLVGPPLKA